MLPHLFARSFDDLLDAWRAYDDLRRARAPLPVLVQAHDRLEQARRTADRHRRAFAPEPRDLEDAAFMIHCSRYDEPVVLYRRDAERHRPEPVWSCLCGSPVTLGSDHPPAVR